MAHGLAGLRVLVVDDNAHMRAIVGAILKSAGINHIREAAHGGHALVMLKDFPADVAIVDFQMAPVDGLEFTKKVRDAATSPNPYLPIIMMTGYAEQSRVVQARDAGVNEFLVKPITAQSLFSRIAEIVERPRAFVRCETYFGPDRRRRTTDNYAGPWRRHDDFQDLQVQ